MLHPDDRVDTVMAASKKSSNNKHNNTKVRRSQTPCHGDLFAPFQGQDDFGRQNQSPDPCQTEPASFNAYADASQPGSLRLLQQATGQIKPPLSSAREKPGGDLGKVSKPAEEPAEAERLATGSDVSAVTTELQFCPVMTDRQVADYFQVSRATIWRWQKEVPDFPQSFTVGGNATRWYRRDIEEHLRQRMAGTSD